MADLQAPRGMSDLLPEDEALWRYVRDTAERVARSFDYRLISTPIVEDVRVFARTVGSESDIVAKEMYVFEDRGGGALALRPEGTAAVCRAYLEHGMASRPQPVRLYYLGPMFRYDRPQAGRYRQLWQFGVECIGDASPAADVEIIELQHTLFRELGLDDLVLRINSIGTAETRRAYVEVLREHLRPHLASLSPDSQRRFETNVLRILDSKEDVGHPALLGAPSILDHLTDDDAQHFAEVRSLLDAAGIAYEVTPSIVRGLDYYARTVWEFEPPVSSGREDTSQGGSQGTVSAGGRYDGLIELLGGPPTPGTGTAMGLERTVLNMRERGIEAPSDGAVDVVTVPLGEAGATAAIAVAQRLRAAGLHVRAGLPGRGLRAQLRSANAVGARYAAIVGDDEAARGVVQLKSLAEDGAQVEVSIEAAAEAVTAHAP
jgi:histidyl-tRNA synthetase